MTKELNKIEMEDNGVENQIFKYIQNNNVDDLKKIFSEQELNCNFYDKDGMTPLQHACYKGNTDIVEFLINQGASVNSTKHAFKYTALHFAALSGNTDVCLLLLHAGAKSGTTNSIGKTASQMAAFVGNHNCVTMINNYVSQSDIEYYTVPRGLESKPKLLPILKTPLYSYIMMINIHPVRLALKMSKILVEECEQVSKVLNLLAEREMKKEDDSNEILGFKFHYLRFILNEIHKIDISKKETDSSETFAKKILKGSRGEEYLDLLLRDCIREFPYRDGFLFQQMVRTLTRKEDSPSALSVIVGSINSQSNFGDDDAPCITCSEPKASKKCSKCKAVQYCDRECQRLHWFVHKKECDRFSNGIGPSGDKTTKTYDQITDDVKVLNI